MKKDHSLIIALYICFAMLLLFGCSREESQHESLIIKPEEEVLIFDIPEIDEEELSIHEDEEPETSRVSTGTVYFLEFPQLTGTYSGLGVNLAEINPANYEVINREVMEVMGMAPWYVAYLAGVRFYQEGNFQSSITEFNRAINLNSDFTNSYVYRGNAQRRMGNLARAIDDYNRALVLNNSYAEVYNYRGFVHAQRGDYHLAIDDYTQAIYHNNDYADAYFNRAHAHSIMGNWDLSIADYTQVIRLEPDNAIAYNRRGNAWFDRGDRENAALDYEAADSILNRFP